MNTGWIERQNASPEDRREYEEERLVLAASEAIAQLMEQLNISKADLATALGTSRAYVTGLLSGNRNMTLRTLGSVACLLDHRIELNVEPLGEGEFIPDWTKAFKPQARPMSVDEINDHFAGSGEASLAA